MAISFCTVGTTRNINASASVLLSPLLVVFAYFVFVAIPAPTRGETQRVRRTWVAERDEDERTRLLKEEEGLAIRHLPKAAPELMRR